MTDDIPFPEETAPTDRGPVTRTLSTDDTTRFVLQWMREHYATLKTSDPDRYCEKLGLILDCVTDMIEQR